MLVKSLALATQKYELGGVSSGSDDSEFYTSYFEVDPSKEERLHTKHSFSASLCFFGTNSKNKNQPGSGSLPSL
eukprot:2658231-Amphidinium_carterae.1